MFEFQPTSDNTQSMRQTLHAGHSHGPHPEIDPDSLNGSSTLVPGTLLGDPVSLGNGYIRSFVNQDAFGNPVTLGYVFNRAATQGLPDTFTDPKGVVPTVLLPSVPLPDGMNLSPFTDLELQYWNEGHDPDLPGVIVTTAEHYDFYFFTVSQAEREFISPSFRDPYATGDFPFPAGGNVVLDFPPGSPPQVIYAEGDVARIIKEPAPGVVPPGFIPTFPVDQFYAENRYGGRYFDNERFETEGPFDPFGEAAFYGFADGIETFFELPVTFAFFDQLAAQGGGALSRQLSRPEIVLKSGFYPTSYSVTSDPVNDRYTMSLDGLEFRVATPVVYDDAFNEDAYLSLYGDVARDVGRGNIDSGFKHYKKHGNREGRFSLFSGTGASDIIETTGRGPKDITGVRFGFISATDGIAASTGEGEIDVLLGSKGADTFVLGYGFTPSNPNPGQFYVGLGDADYALIQKFRDGQDQIRLFGSLIDYNLQSSSNGTNIYYRGDIVGIVEGVNLNQLSLISSLSDGTFLLG